MPKLYFSVKWQSVTSVNLKYESPVQPVARINRDREIANHLHPRRFRGTGPN